MFFLPHHRFHMGLWECILIKIIFQILSSWLFVARFPEVADNIRKEIAEVVGDNEPLSCSHLHKLPYLEAVLHEVFRHSSMSAVTIPHRVIENTVLQGYKIAKDTVVFLNFYSANHDPDAWDDPDTFSPDRFLKRTDDGSRKIDSSKARKYLVFSAGPRKCPGGDFTRMWLSLSMAILLQKYHFVPDPQCQPTEISTFGLTLKPSTFKIKLVPRDHATNVEYRWVVLIAIATSHKYLTTQVEETSNFVSC